MNDNYHNPSAWFVYVAPGSGSKFTNLIAAHLDYTTINYREGGDWKKDPAQSGIVFDCGSLAKSSPKQHKFRPSKTQTRIWVVEHDFFGQAVCADAYDPDDIDGYVTCALENLGFELKGVGVDQ